MRRIDRETETVKEPRAATKSRWVPTQGGERSNDELADIIKKKIILRPLAAESRLEKSMAKAFGRGLPTNVRSRKNERGRSGIYQVKSPGEVTSGELKTKTFRAKGGYTLTKTDRIKENRVRNKVWETP